MENKIDNKIDFELNDNEIHNFLERVKILGKTVNDVIDAIVYIFKSDYFQKIIITTQIVIRHKEYLSWKHFRQSKLIRRFKK